MKKNFDTYDEWDFPPNYDAESHDWTFIKGIALAVVCMLLLLIAYLIGQ